MKILKIIGIIIFFIVAIFLITALFVRKSYQVDREVTIHVNQDSVFNFIKYLKNQDLYSKWAKMDPLMQKKYRGEDGKVGFVSAWNSNNKNVGKGEQEIIKIVSNERIDFELRFFEPFQSTQQAYMACSPDSSGTTKVIWGFQGHMNYPANLMLVFMDMEKMIGDDLQTGLNNLKKVLENKE